MALVCQILHKGTWQKWSNELSANENLMSPFGSQLVERGGSLEPKLRYSLISDAQNWWIRAIIHFRKSKANLQKCHAVVSSSVCQWAVILQPRTVIRTPPHEFSFPGNPISHLPVNWSFFYWSEYVLNLIFGWKWKAALTPYSRQQPAVAGRKASQDPQRHSTEVPCIPSKG